MDNVLKSTIRQEIQNLFQNNEVGSTLGESSNMQQRTYLHNHNDLAPMTKKAKKSEARLGALLTKIRQKNGENPNTKKHKTRKLQVKYERFNHKENKFQTVKQKCGGGSRFLDVNQNSEITFEELKQQAIDVFFDFERSSNFFSEAYFDCNITLNTVAGCELIYTENLWDYLNRKCLLLSKTVLILRSTYAMSTSSDEDEDLLLQRYNGCNDITDIMNDLPTIDAGFQPAIDNNADCFASPLRVHSHENLDEKDDLNEELSSIDLPTVEMHKETDNLNEDMPSIILHPEEMHRETVTADLLNEPISISVNRLKVRDDLIKAFIENEIALQQHINYTVIDPRGIPEAGVGAGVDRDVYSMFWSDVGNSLLIGAEQRVPFVRHDFYIQHWKSVGKILVKGFIDTGYLPTIVNYAFLHYCLFGELADDKLLSYFLLYLAADERNCVEKALKGNQDILQSDEFAEILEQFKCRTLITSENLQEVLIELARQELYQKPHIMASCWSELFGDLRNYINSPQALEDIYERLKPTNRKVISLIDCETKTDAERDVLGYLKRFIRSLNEGDLRKLIQFLTGSELLVISKISVAFYINDVSVLRHPIAHTCGPTLELPTSYNNFCELREEFASILMQSTWGMDIV